MTLLATLQAKTPQTFGPWVPEHSVIAPITSGYLYTEAEHAAVLERLKQAERPDERKPILCPDCNQPFGFSFAEKRVTCGCKRQA